jgi:MarR family transcriptional regulator, organic hydroperoxide resistance regulator
MRDFVVEKGTAAFGTRLRRLSERLDRDVRELYRRHGFSFEPSWFPVFTALSELGPMSVGDLAERMGISHPAVSQIRAKLLKAGLVRVRADAGDQRRQMLQLTEKGKALVEKLRPLWTAITETTEQLCRESAPQLLHQLTKIEAALDDRSLIDRVARDPAKKTKRAPRAKGDKANANP